MSSDDMRESMLRLKAWQVETNLIGLISDAFSPCCKGPYLTAKALSIVNTFGGWTDFMTHHGYNPIDPNQVEMARQLAEHLAS